MVTLYDRDYATLDEHRYTVREIAEGFGLPLWDEERPFPIFDEAYRGELQTKIEEHFWFRRIASSTPQLFVYYLNRRMRENMPTFNALYEKLLAESLDPFASYESDTTGNSESAGHGESTSDGSTTGTSLTRSINSNTPASFMQSPEDPKYMSALVQGTSDSDSSSKSRDTSDNTSNSNYLTHVTSRGGYLGDAVLSALTTGFLNTDLMVCDMLEPLFMQTWDDMPL